MVTYYTHDNTLHDSHRSMFPINGAPENPCHLFTVLLVYENTTIMRGVKLTYSMFEKLSLVMRSHAHRRFITGNWTSSIKVNNFVL